MTTANQTDAQMKLADVTQADREAAADFFECSTFAGRDAFLRGDEDSSDVVQAFAKHRQATEARAQGLVELLEMMDSIEYKELNLSNYTHDDVCALNNAYVEMQLILTEALATWRRT